MQMKMNYLRKFDSVQANIHTKKSEKNHLHCF
jgi:hypothetical protein